MGYFVIIKYHLYRQPKFLLHQKLDGYASFAFYFGTNAFVASSNTLEVLSESPSGRMKACNESLRKLKCHLLLKLTPLTYLAT